jgi:beta-fructofuranosidase
MRQAGPGYDVAVAERTLRSQLWISGPLQKKKDVWRNGQAQDVVSLVHEFGGKLDHGCFYAANSFWDPRTEAHIVIGWIHEVGLPDDIRHRQGWSGLLSVPRVLGLMTIPKVSNVRVSALKDITSVHTSADGASTFTVIPLKIESYPTLALRRGRQGGSMGLATPLDLFPHGVTWWQQQPPPPILTFSSLRWECEISVTTCCSRVGFEIGHSKGKLCFR